MCVLIKLTSIIALHLLTNERSAIVSFGDVCLNCAFMILLSPMMKEKTTLKSIPVVFTTKEYVGV